MECFARKEPSHFVDGQIDGVSVVRLISHADVRGWLVELYRSDELAEAYLPVMAYVSQTQPGMARGPHEHREQTDVFGLLGGGQWRFYLWDVRAESPSWGQRQRIEVGQDDYLRIVVPPGVVHAYKNIGTVPAMVFNATNRLYAGEGRKLPVDEIRHEDRPDSPYKLD